MRLEAASQEYLRPEVSAFLDRVSDPDTRQTCTQLLQAIEQADIPDELLAPLGQVLELSLSSGRLRRLHGPHAEMDAMKLFRGTPQGNALQQSLNEANQALGALAGQTLRQINFTLQAPGAFTLSLDTDECHLRLIIDRSGVRLHGIEMGL